MLCQSSSGTDFANPDDGVGLRLYIYHHVSINIIWSHKPKLFFFLQASLHENRLGYPLLILVIRSLGYWHLQSLLNISCLHFLMKLITFLRVSTRLCSGHVSQLNSPRFLPRVYRHSAISYVERVIQSSSLYESLCQVCLVRVKRLREMKLAYVGKRKIASNFSAFPR